MRSRNLLLLLSAIPAGVIAVFLIAKLGPPTLPPTLRGATPAHLRVVWQAGPQHRAVLLWDSALPGADWQVAWDIRAHDAPADYPQRVTAVTSTRYPDPESSGLVAWRHRADLTGLPAGSRVDFVVTGADVRSATHWFRTAPDQDWPVTIIAGGDCLDARADRTAMNRRIAALAAADPLILAFAHQGDFVRHGERLDQWLEWLEDHGATTGTDGRLLPLIPARGNHEATGPLFDFVFGREGLPSWYVTELSPELSWISLDTNRPTGGPQLEFLRDTLAARQDRRLRIAQYHAQMYPAVIRNSHYETFWAPAFEAGGLDVAIESNGHAIKRTAPILAGAIDPAGVVYLGEGGLGAKQRTPSRDAWYLQEPGWASRGEHVWKLRADDQGLHLGVILADGSVAHREILPPRKRRAEGQR